MMTRFRRQYVRLVAGENLPKVELALVEASAVDATCP